MDVKLMMMMMMMYDVNIISERDGSAAAMNVLSGAWMLSINN